MTSGISTRFMPASELSLPASSDPQGGGPRVDSRRLAWQREMERAQTDSWFKKPQAETPDRQSNQPRPSATRVQQSKNESSGSEQRTYTPTYLATMVAISKPPISDLREARHLVAGDLIQRTFAPLIDEAGQTAFSEQGLPFQRVSAPLLCTADPQIALGLEAARPAGGATAVEGQRDEPTAESRNLRPNGAWITSVTLPGSREPVRLHVQYEGETAKVWVGLDGSHEAHLPQLASLVSECLQGQGLRVISVVCNGKTFSEIAVDEQREARIRSHGILSTASNNSSSSPAGVHIEIIAKGEI